MCCKMNTKVYRKKTKNIYSLITLLFRTIINLEIHLQCKWLSLLNDFDMVRQSHIAHSIVHAEVILDLVLQVIDMILCLIKCVLYCITVYNFLCKRVVHYLMHDGLCLYPVLHFIEQVPLCILQGFEPR